MTAVLLPPSESKHSALTGPKLSLKHLSFPQLTNTRQEVIQSLVALSNGRRDKARTVLGLSAKQDSEIERNQQLLTEPTAPAWQIYVGVLYDALDFGSLTKSQQLRLANMTYVQSALFGVISLEDNIPAYRLSGDCTIPNLGSLTKLWALECSQVLAEHGDFIIDLRSGIYTKLGPLPSGVSAVVPKIMQRMPSGPPKVVSHHNKATKGRIVRAIAQSKTKVNSVDSLAEVVTTLGADVDVKQSTKSETVTTLEMVVDAL